MRLRILIALPLFLLPGRMVSGQVPELSPRATISLLTCGPGTEIYSYFGHSALRVSDPDIRLDRVYNYGTFDFNVPNFYTQFINGKLWYMLSVVRYQGFLAEYVSENRFIKGRPLDLTQEEKQRLFGLLEINALPENKHYWYDFFLDNCSTRIRDIVTKATNGRFMWPAEPIKHFTYRQLIKPYLNKVPWTRTGIFLMLASGADRESTQEGYMFLPDYLDELFGKAATVDGRPMCLPERTLYLPDSPSETGKGIFNPIAVLGFVLVLSWLLSGYRKIPWPMTRSWFSILFFLSGALGLLFGYMWLFSDHQVCHGNLNLLWALPLNIILSVTLWVPRMGGFNRVYSRMALAALLFFLASFALWKQKVPAEAILIALTLLPGWILLSGFKVFGNAEPKDQTN